MFIRVLCFVINSYYELLQLRCQSIQIIGKFTIFNSCNINTYLHFIRAAGELYLQRNFMEVLKIIFSKYFERESVQTMKLLIMKKKSGFQVPLFNKEEYILTTENVF